MTLPVHKAMGTGHETTPVIPTHVAGDFMMLFVSHANVGVNVATPSGWTKLQGTPVEVDNTADVVCTVFYRFALSSSETNPSISTGGANYVWGVVGLWTGVNIATPVHRAAPSWISGTAIYAAGMQTIVPDSLVLNVCAYSADFVANYTAASVSNSTSGIANLTVLYDAGTTTGNGGGLVIIQFEKADIGIVNPTLWTATNTGFVASITVALQAADKELPILERLSRKFNTGSM